MAQNTSTAVMAQRHQSMDDLDFFPTPGWGTRALSEYLVDLKDAKVWEPACGRGHMASVLSERAGSVFSSDIMNFGYGKVFDFLSMEGLGLFPPPFGDVDWIVTNPPFVHFHSFASIAFNLARRGVALLGRLQMLETVGRWENIFQPFAGHWTVAPFVERLPMEEGCVAQDGSTATAYAWLVIDKTSCRPSPLVHIPPCRSRLERISDYDPKEYVDRIRALKKARAAERRVIVETASA